MEAEKTGDELKTVAKSYEIVETLREMDGARVSELAEVADMSTTTAYRHLSTLASIGYVVKEGDVYCLSSKFIRLGQYARNRNRVAQIAEDKVKELAEMTGERAQFVVEERGLAVYLRCETGENAVATDSGIGKRVSLHSTAAGKAILAHLPEYRVEQVLDRRGLPKETEQTITDRDEFYEELERVKDRGYATNIEEHIQGLSAVAVPVQRRSGESIGALSVSGPLHRLSDDGTVEEMARTLLESANEIELKAEYS